MAWLKLVTFDFGPVAQMRASLSAVPS